MSQLVYTRDVNEYCPRCRKRRRHIKLNGIKLCTHCGHQEDSFKGITFKKRGF